MTPSTNQVPRLHVQVTDGCGVRSSGRPTTKPAKENLFSINDNGSKVSSPPSFPKFGVSLQKKHVAMEKEDCERTNFKTRFHTTSFNNFNSKQLDLSSTTSPSSPPSMPRLKDSSQLQKRRENFIPRSQLRAGANINAMTCTKKSKELAHFEKMGSMTKDSGISFKSCINLSTFKDFKPTASSALKENNMNDANSPNKEVLFNELILSPPPYSSFSGNTKAAIVLQPSFKPPPQDSMKGVDVERPQETNNYSCNVERTKKRSGYQCVDGDEMNNMVRSYYSKKTPRLNNKIDKNLNYIKEFPSPYHLTPSSGHHHNLDNNNHASQNRFPFSPNPFSPHYSPNAPPPHKFENQSMTSPFSPSSKFLNSNSSVLRTPTKLRVSRNIDPCMSVDSNSVSSTCNMSVDNCQHSVQNSYNFKSNTISCVARGESDSNDYNLTCSSGIHFSSSPVVGRINEKDPGKDFLQKTDGRASFDMESPTLSACDASPELEMSFDMNPRKPQKKLKPRSNVQPTLHVDCELSEDKIDKNNEGISPTDVAHFPPPPTPCKGRKSVSHLSKAEEYDITFHFECNAPKRVDSSSDEDVKVLFPSKKMSSSDMCASDFHTSQCYAAKPICSSNSIYYEAKSRFASDFEEVGQLGMGSFGTVYKCMSRLDGCMYAVKAAKKKAKGNAERDRMLQEVFALAALCDKTDTGTFHIVRYHQAWMEDDRLFIQTELCSSTLEEEMEKGILLRNVPRRFKLLREILLALELIHKNNMVHLDIKPENIFIKGDQYKLGDFGLVTQATTENDEIEEGDSRYLSLELLAGDHKDLTKSDIFSLGATLYETCIGRTLPANGHEWHKIRNDEIEFIVRNDICCARSNAPEELQEIIKQMMCSSASMRPSASELLQRRHLLSEEQKQLLTEQNKVKAAYESLKLQRKMLSNLSPTKRRRKLVRSSTWDVCNSRSMMDPKIC